MLGESFLLLRSKGAERPCGDEPGEEIGTLPKLVVFLASLLITGVTAIAVATPFALLHLR